MAAPPQPNQSPLPPTAPVVIVGAGAAGSALAYTLVRPGVCPLLLDARDGPSADSRALGVHARSLEVLGRAVAAEMVAAGVPLEGMHMFDCGTPVGTLMSGATSADTPYPFALALSQVRREWMSMVGVLQGE